MKKKTHWKQQPRNHQTSLRVRLLTLTLRDFARLFISIGFIASTCLVFLAGCAASGTNTSLSTDSKVYFNSLPVDGAWLQPQRDLFACESVIAARFMGDFGFLHPQCKQLLDIGSQEYQVKGKRELIQLNEGPMWLIDVVHEDKTYIVPVPWHDWV